MNNNKKYSKTLLLAEHPCPQMASSPVILHTETKQDPWQPKQAAKGCRSCAQPCCVPPFAWTLLQLEGEAPRAAGPPNSTYCTEGWYAPLFPSHPSNPQPADTNIGDEGRESWNHTALALQSSPLQSPMLCRKHEAQQNCSTSALNPLFAISLMRKKHLFFFPWDLFQKIFLILLRNFMSVQDTNYVFCFVFFLFVLDFYKNACERSLCSWSYKACPSTETTRSLGSKARSHI